MLHVLSMLSCTFFRVVSSKAFSLYVCWIEVRGKQQCLLQIVISLFRSHPQIEKIMTLIGAGIDFSRDQQYATPGRVSSLLQLHPVQFQIQFSAK